jgi:hypothetical protein
MLIDGDAQAGLATAFWRPFDDRQADRALQFMMRRYDVGEGIGWKCYFRKDELVRRHKACCAALQAGHDPHSAIAGFVRDIHRRIAKLQKTSKDFWIDDTPHNVYVIPEILEMFPDAKIIHLIRDGRLVAQSFVARGWRGGSWRASLQTWFTRVTVGRAFGIGYSDDTYLELDFGNFAADPEFHYRQIAEFIGVPFQARALKGFNRDRSRSPDPLSDRDNEYFWRLAAPLAKEFGWPQTL